MLSPGVYLLTFRLSKWKLHIFCLWQQPTPCMNHHYTDIQYLSHLDETYFCICWLKYSQNGQTQCLIWATQSFYGRVILFPSYNCEEIWLSLLHLWRDNAFPLSLVKRNGSLLNNLFYHIYWVKRYGHPAELQISRGIEDNSDNYSYFSTKTYVVVPH